MSDEVIWRLLEYGGGADVPPLFSCRHVSCNFNPAASSFETRREALRLEPWRTFDT
jgi:hypothetical protein